MRLVDGFKIGLPIILSFQILAFCLFSHNVEAKPAKSKTKRLRVGDSSLRLLPYSELSSLSKRKLRLYLTGVTLLMRDIEAWQAKTTPEVIAQLNEESFLFKGLVGEWFELAVGERIWAEEKPDTSNYCINAGFIKSKNAQGLCPLPPHCEKGDSGQEMRQCNPLLFGEGVCFLSRTKAERLKATTTCFQNAKEPAGLKEFLNGKKDDWDKFVTQFGEFKAFCEKGSQKQLCSKIENRITELKAIVGKSEAPVSSPPAEMSPSKGDSSQAGVLSPAGEDKLSNPLNAPWGKDHKVCNPAYLDIDIASPVEDDNKYPEASEAFLSFERIQELICEGKYDEYYIKGRLKRIDERMVWLNGSLAKRKQEKAYYISLWGDLKDNVEKCYDFIKSDKFRKRTPPASMNLDLDKEGVGYLERLVNGGSERFYFSRNSLTASLLAKSFDVCAISIREKQSHSPSPSPPSSPSKAAK
ncbi:MAG: hypothetical protein KDD35_05765 [Bdellovibrionales bacterium]|nr:hypothetical protein [Bdellovibrionales bacterium]